MKIILAAPNVQFVEGGLAWRTAGVELEKLGFTFARREFGAGAVLNVTNTVMIEIETIADLVELQARIALPIKVEHGYFEVVHD
jgi:hypothetical protein